MNAKLLKNIRQVIPYTVGEQPQEKVIKLNTNENPYPPSPKVIDALKEMDAKELKLYADPESKELTKAIADYHQVEYDQVFVGLGADDVIGLCYLTFFNSEKPILFPDITYSFYEVWAKLYGNAFRCPPLDKDFRLVKSDYCGDIGGIIFPNPNAPTGIYEGLEFIEDILKANPEVVVIIDEAYIDYAGRSACELIPKYDNLIVVQTYSKARSLAGMRIGYALSNKELIGYLNDVKNSFNSYTLNLPSQLAGVASVLDNEYFEEVIKFIVDTREWLKEEMAKLGFEYTDGAGNFIFVTHKEYLASYLYEELKKRKVYVRYWNSYRIKDYLRITIGTKEEMEIFLTDLKEIMRGDPVSR
jgi:histidinol-phosphate aminotransferase